jgi:hypothetical protein
LFQLKPCWYFILVILIVNQVTLVHWFTFSIELHNNLVLMTLIVIFSVLPMYVWHGLIPKGLGLRPGLNTPHTCTMVKILKLAIYLFLEFWLQIWFQKCYISPNDTQFLINKQKNRGRFLFTFPGLVWAWGVSCQIVGLKYVGFSDSGQANVNAINFWIFWNFLRL